MKTILNDSTNEIIIKNSRFIACCFKMSSNDISSYLKFVIEMYPKATHYCYGYIYDDIKHFSDDGEPSGTAGMPILNVLEKLELNKVLVVVVRYFGGIKLGAAGLVRAYTKSVTNAIFDNELIPLVLGYKVKLVFNYNLEKQINYLLRDISIDKKEYKEDITYIFECSREKYLEIENYKPVILEEVYIEKSS